LFILAAQTPFAESELEELASDAPAVLKRYYPNYADVYESLGWSFNRVLDRVYDSSKACRVLGYVPKDSFSSLLDERFKSVLSLPDREFEYTDVCGCRDLWSK
jgi:hypothetical protein